VNEGRCGMKQGMRESRLYGTHLYMGDMMEWRK
jgi:hypothetical protein